jgi:hypothetical protein
VANPAGTTSNLVPFRRGQSGNPGGKPEGARNRLQASFLYALAEDFDTYGEAAIEAARKKDPMGYVRCVAALMPQKVDMNGPLEDWRDEELAQALAYIRSHITTEGAREGAESEGNGTDGGGSCGDPGVAGLANGAS